MKCNKLFFDVKKIEIFHSHLIFSYAHVAPPMGYKKYQTADYKCCSFQSPCSGNTGMTTCRLKNSKASNFRASYE